MMKGLDLHTRFIEHSVVVQDESEEEGARCPLHSTGE